MTSDELPRLWSVHIADDRRLSKNVAVDVEPHMRPYDYVCLWKRGMCRGFARVEDVNKPDMRHMQLTVPLSATALLSDTILHYRFVLEKLLVLRNQTFVRLEMLPTDKTVERVYGPLDARWHMVVAFFKVKYHTTYAKWQAWLAFIDGRGPNIMLPVATTPSDTDRLPERLPNLIALQIKEYKLWTRSRRSIALDLHRLPMDLDTRLSKKIAFELRLESARTYGGRWNVYTVLADDAEFVMQHLHSVLSPEMHEHVTLSRPGHIHMPVADDSSDEIRLGEMRLQFGLPYLRWSCCAAALAFSSADLPVYVVLWITYWLPGMYWLKKEFERVRLIEGVYNSRKKVLIAREERKNKQRI